MQHLPLTLGPRYRALSLLAKGGMGAVYLGQTTDASRPFAAIKLMHGHIADSPEAVSLFIDEARIGTRLDHPNVVRVLDVDVAEDTPFIVMEYVEGLSWSRLLRRFQEENETVPVDIVARVVHDALRGLSSAHAIGVVHRDVSPHNLLIGCDGRVRVTDFGIATFTGRLSATAVGEVRGKLGYISPEQVSRGVVDARADIFSIGIVLWQALTGRKLFECDTESETLAKVLREPIPPPTNFAPDLPLDLEDVCLKALERTKDRRWQTADELADALANAAPLASCERLGEIVERLGASTFEKLRAARAAAPPLSARHPALPLPLPVTVAPPAKPKPPVRAIALAAAGVALVLVGTFIGRASTPPPPPPSPVASTARREAVPAAAPEALATTGEAPAEIASVPPMAAAPTKQHRRPTRGHGPTTAKSAARPSDDRPFVPGEP